MGPESTHSTITIFRGWKDPGYVWSPYVTKLEARFRFAGLSYRLGAGSPRSAPKGKIPYIELAQPDQEPEIIADSAQIIDKFVHDGLLPDLNENLGAVDAAHDLALRALLEEKLYFYQTYEKWHDNYYLMRDKALCSLAYPMRILVGLLAYRSTMTTLHGQGTARFSSTEIAVFRENIWKNINNLLAESRKRVSDKTKCFWILGGDSPSEADAVLYGFIIGAMVSYAAPKTQKLVRSFPAIEDYAGRIHNQYFPDYTHWDDII